MSSPVPERDSPFDLYRLRQQHPSQHSQRLSSDIRYAKIPLDPDSSDLPDGIGSPSEPVSPDIPPSIEEPNLQWRWIIFCWLIWTINFSFGVLVIQILDPLKDTGVAVALRTSQSLLSGPVSVSGLICLLDDHMSKLQGGIYREAHVSLNGSISTIIMESDHRK